MIFAIVLVNLLLTSAALAAPSLEARLGPRGAGRQSDAHQHLEASVESRSLGLTYNYAGAAYRGTGPYTAVSGVFSIPPFGSSGNASVWVGLDGLSCNVIFQTGLNFNLDHRGLTYTAWYKWQTFSTSTHIPTFTGTVGNYSGIDFDILDVVMVTVIASTRNSGTAMVENVTKKVLISTAIIDSPYALCLQDAAWMLEVPEVLPAFHSIVFSDAYATTPHGNIGPGGADRVILEQGTQIVLPYINSSIINITCYNQ